MIKIPSGLQTSRAQVRRAQRSVSFWAGATCRALQVLGLVACGLSAQAVADAPQMEWQFNEGSQADGVFVPVFGSTTATLAGPSPVFDDRPPQALVLTGNSKDRHRVVVADDYKTLQLPLRKITVEAWVRMDGDQEWSGIVGCLQDNGAFERGWLLGCRKTQFCFAISSVEGKRLTYLTAPRSFESGFWYHVVGTYDGQTMQLFVDGVPVATSGEQREDIAYPPHAPVTIGAYHDDDEFYALPGRIARISLWNQALDEDQVAARFSLHKSEFPEIDPITPVATDWPTWRRDSQRTGISDESLDLPLALHWTWSARHPPQPAWPAPADNDFWHKKSNLKARVNYDRANHVVVAGGRVMVGSSADGSVTCIDARSGRMLWDYFTEGPVRLAPTIAGDRVLFGSDDGSVYCLDVADGRLLWKQRVGPSDRRIPGNERIISAWPVRTGVLVDDGVAYTCAGLFPNQGVIQAAFDSETGRRLADNSLDVSAQGYLERRSGQLYVTTGRDPAGAFVSKLKRFGKGVGREISRIPAEFQYEFIGAGDVRIGGGDDQVAAFDVRNGEQLWRADVDGAAWSLAVAHQSLFVSTDKGHVYCFANPETSTPVGESPAPRGSAGTPDANTVDNTAVAATIEPVEPVDLEGSTREMQRQYAKLADDIVRLTKARLGYCLVLNDSDGNLAPAIARRTEMQIVSVVSDFTSADILRRRTGRSDFGNRITIHHIVDGDPLPFTDYAFNLIVDGRLIDPAFHLDVTPDLARCQRPCGGIIVQSVSQSQLNRRERLAGTGDWTHMYANPGNTICSTDNRVGGQLALQWFGRPGPQQMIDRHHRTVAPLFHDGRMFIPGNNRVIACDAYNGTQLWNIDIPESRRIGAYRDCSYLCVGDEGVYVAAGDCCRILDPQTGIEKRRLPVPQVDSDHEFEWGFLAVQDGLVFGSTVRKGSSRRGHSLEAINEGTFWDHRPLVCSDTFFVMDPHTGDVVWSWLPASGLLINSTVTIADGKAYFVESINPNTRDGETGRVTPPDLLSHGSRLVAIDVVSGSVGWSRELDLTKIEHTLSCASANGCLVVSGSYNSGKDRDKDSVLYDIHVVSADDGSTLWSKTQRQNTKIGGDHGEQDHRPVIVGDRLYCEPYAYNLESGADVADWTWNKDHRRGCGQISASASALFFRNSNPTMFDLTSNSYRKVTTTTRPGCWVNMIPAGGLLLIPEASSGCTCDYAIQTSMAFLPIRESVARKAP